MRLATDLLTPSGAGAVMAGRSAEQLNEHDYFPTPPWAARAGGELIRMLDPAARSVWEPACGEGHMVFGLKDYFPAVIGSDIADYESDLQDTVQDFLRPEADRLVVGDRPHWVVSNPPFVDGEGFIRAAWDRAERGVAMLLRLQFTEGGGRYAMFTRDCPLAMAATFSERVPMFAGRWDPGGSSATAYRWFFFLKPDALDESPLAGAINMARTVGCSLERLIGPGTRQRLERRQDLLRFGPLSILACARMAAELEAAGDAKSLKKAGELRADAKRIRELLDAAAGGLFGGEEQGRGL